MSQNTSATPTSACSTVIFADAFGALERGCSGSSPLDLRDQAIVAVLKTTAARSSSVRLLRVRDVDLRGDALALPWNASQRRHVVALLPEAREAIVKYLTLGYWELCRSDARAARSSEAVLDDYLFPAKASRHQSSGRPLGAAGLSAMLTRRHRAGDGSCTHFGSNLVRRGVIQLLAEGGMPLDDIVRHIYRPPTSMRWLTRESLAWPAAQSVERALRNGHL